jgi:ubiquitin-conjugating enzyme E2 variant
MPTTNYFEIEFSLLSLVSAWLMADFMSGIFHWFEDRYGVESWPVIGPLVVSPNIMHHSQPRAFLDQSVWSRNWTTVVPSLSAAAVAWYTGAHWLATAFALLATANEVHAWAHQKCSRPIRALQMLGVFQSQEQHASHHAKPFDRNYCVMSDWMNPVLQAAGFWSAAEALLAVFGVRPLAIRSEA